MFTTNKTSLNQQLIEKKFRLNLIKLLLKKELFNQSMKVLNILNLKVSEELLFLTLYKKKFQSEFLNQLFMMYLFINMNMYLLKNLVNLIIVMIIIVLLLVSLILSTLQKLKSTKTEENILMVTYKEVEKEDKLKKMLLSKMLSNIMVNFMEKILSLELMVWVLLPVFMKMKMKDIKL